MKFTRSQNDAIAVRGKMLVVSAGAGSGKTTVLTQRLIERIKNGESVNDFLVVTFTNAAAADIRKKLANALAEASAAEPSNRHLYRQSFLLPDARICTISSYCLSLIRENFAVLGISLNARMVDETEEAMLMRRVAEQLTDDKCRTGEEAFLNLARQMADMRGVSALVDSMLALYSSLRVTEDWGTKLYEFASSLEADAKQITENGVFSTPTGAALKKRLTDYVNDLRSRADEAYAFVCTVSEEDKHARPFQALAAACEELAESIGRGYGFFCETAEKVFEDIPRVYTKGLLPEEAEYISSEKKTVISEARKIAKRYCFGGDEAVARSCMETASVARTVTAFLQELDERYMAYKTEAGVLDFSDLEGYALKLLQTESGEPTELCLNKRTEFSEILIDEYQDVNPLQDKLFTLLSNGHNRFIVGDVKQSIYRFRNAYPDIFLGYKEASPDLASKGGNSARIFLRENFRCSQCVIDYVNHVFKTVTKDTPYRREYENEWLIHASERKERAHPVTLAVAEKTENKKEASGEAKAVEAEYIAREIKRLVQDEEGDDGTEFAYSDIAVMLGAIKGYSIPYEKAFRKYGIPYKTDKAESFLENTDIMLAVAALKAIDNPTDDISLCAMMRSPIFNFTSDELFRIRRSEGTSAFYYSVASHACPKRGKSASKCTYHASGHKNKGLRTKCREFLTCLRQYRAKSFGVPSHEFLRGFLVSSGLMRICVANGNRNSISLLYEYARRCESTAYHGLTGFLEYLDELADSKKAISDAAVAGGENAVSLMTIHKSKGLEYRICFLAGTEKAFYGARRQAGITYLRGQGIFMRLRNPDRLTETDTLYNVLAQDAESDAAYGEELRKLYVALTRAKERLYITGVAPASYFSEKTDARSAKSWLELLAFAASSGEQPFLNKEIIPPRGTEGGGFIAPEPKKVFVPNEQMLACAAYVYPFCKETNTPAKISVSELREGLLEDDEYNRSINLSVPQSRMSQKPVFVSETQTTASDIGTANHLFMQFCNFENAETHGVAAEAKRLLENAMISKRQYEMLDEAALDKFFSGTLYRRIRASKRVWREKRFSVRDGTLSDMLVQGVIDCFFENPDESFTVVDYKTDRIKCEEELTERHRVQLECYCRAVEGMTGGTVHEALLYSFALGREVSIR